MSCEPHQPFAQGTALANFNHYKSFEINRIPLRYKLLAACCRIGSIKSVAFVVISWSRFALESV